MCSKVSWDSFCTACLSNLWVSRLLFVVNGELQMSQLMGLSVGVSSASVMVWFVDISSVWVV